MMVNAIAKKISIFRITFFTNLFLSFNAYAQVSHEIVSLNQYCKAANYACSFIHKVGLIGKDNGQIVSNNPIDEDAKLAEAIGPAVACGKGTGSLSLVKYNNNPYLIGAAHTFYRDGRLKCNEGYGIFGPDFHYKGNAKIDHQKFIKFKLPPLNHQLALKEFNEKVRSNSRLRDIVILKLENESILKSQSGKERTILELLSVSDDKLPEISTNYELIFISNRKNFHNGREASIQKNCTVKKIRGSFVKRHNCDTGQGSSGAPIILKNRDVYNIIGVHTAGSSNVTEDKNFNYETINAGNFFIPSEYVLQQFESLFGKSIKE